MNVIEVKQLKKAFGEHVIYQDFSMEIKQGEFVAIEGKSGSGKSTLLNILGLLDKPDAGTVTLFEKQNIKPFTSAAEKMLKYKIGYLFQNFALLEDKTVYANMLLVIEHHKIQNKRQVIAKALETVGLAGYEDKKIFQCSGGEQQRIAIARLLIKPCELILADEPTGSLDKENKQEIFQLLKQLQQDGKTIVVVSHDPDLIQIADRTIEIC